jgi:hypothetical protein
MIHTHSAGGYPACRIENYHNIPILSIAER